MDKKLIFLILIFMAVFTALISYIFFQEPVRLRAKAQQLASASKSPIFSIKSIAVADGRDECKVTGFIRTDDGSVLPNKRAKLVLAEESIKVVPSEQTSDATGKVEFRLTSTLPIEVSIKMRIEDSIETKQESKCIFREFNKSQ